MDTQPNRDMVGKSKAAFPRGEIITRGILPHWYVPGAAHFVTYRLAGTIPQSVLQELQIQQTQKLNSKPPFGLSRSEWRARVHKQLFEAYDHFLDSNRDMDWLIKPEAASIVRNNLHFHDGNKYHLMAYCVMPNHVHTLLQPLIKSLDTHDSCAADTTDNDLGEITDAMNWNESSHT